MLKTAKIAIVGRTIKLLIDFWSIDETLIQKTKHVTETITSFQNEAVLNSDLRSLRV